MISENFIIVDSSLLYISPVYLKYNKKYVRKQFAKPVQQRYVARVVNLLTFVLAYSWMKQ